MFEVTRQQIADKARSLLGVRFLHQGRSRLGVDCVGMLYVILDELGYPNIVDVEGYRSAPPTSVIYETFQANFDEIPVKDVGLGDIYLMRVGGGRKVRHASIVISDVTNIEDGIVPELAHAYAMGGAGRVIKEPVKNWLPNCAYGFRLKGLVD